MLFPRENLWLFLDFILLFYITSTTENVPGISVLWQLCIRLIYSMAFECELRYKKSKYTNILFVKFIIVNINLTLICIILFVIYIL